MRRLLVRRNEALARKGIDTCSFSLGTFKVFKQRRNEALARKGIDTKRIAFHFCYYSFKVEMEPQPERALIRFISDSILSDVPNCRNGAPAREGIDTNASEHSCQ